MKLPIETQSTDIFLNYTERAVLSWMAIWCL